MWRRKVALLCGKNLLFSYCITYSCVDYFSSPRRVFQTVWKSLWSNTETTTMVLILMIKHINHHIIICLTGGGWYDCPISHSKKGHCWWTDISQTLDNKITGRRNQSFVGGRRWVKKTRAEEEEGEARRGERGVKNVRRGEENGGEKIQYIFNLADVIRLCVCQERRIS